MHRIWKRGFLVNLHLLLAFLLISNTGSVIYAQQECNSLGAPQVTTGSIAASDPTQTGRLFRTVSNTTTCLLRRTATTSGTTALNYDQYTFTNNTGGPACIFVDLDAVGCGVATNQISMAAYLGSYNPASILTNLIAEPGGSTGQNFANSMSFQVAAGATYVIVVHNVNAGTSCPSYTFKRYETNNCRATGYDAANDGNADLAIFRPSGEFASWYSMPATGGAVDFDIFASAGDIPTPGDYVGDEATDPAVFRPSNGTWYTSQNPATNYDAQRWGLSTDIPVHGDYDRDGKTDLAVYRPSDNNWYILRSDGNVWSQLTIGAAGGQPVQADYDGDGKIDPGVWSPSTGLWSVIQSSGNYGSVYGQLIFGTTGDRAVPADYDGDGKADAAVFRPSNGTWYINRSSLTTGQFQFIPFGMAGDEPQPADYDGDRKADIAVFRPSNGTWYLNRSSAGVLIAPFGQNGDIPVSSASRILP